MEFSHSLDPYRLLPTARKQSSNNGWVRRHGANLSTKVHANGSKVWPDDLGDYVDRLAMTSNRRLGTTGLTK
jgi:hypothetical protein